MFLRLLGQSCWWPACSIAMQAVAPAPAAARPAVQLLPSGVVWCGNPLRCLLKAPFAPRPPALGTQGRPPGVLGLWPSRAVTFLENHDTGALLEPCKCIIAAGPAAGAALVHRWWCCRLYVPRPLALVLCSAPSSAVACAHCCPRRRLHPQPLALPLQAPAGGILLHADALRHVSGAGMQLRAALRLRPLPRGWLRGNACNTARRMQGGTAPHRLRLSPHLSLCALLRSPCVFYDHFFDPNLKKNILELLTVRKKHGINAKSEVRWLAVFCCLHLLLLVAHAAVARNRHSVAHHKRGACQVARTQNSVCPASPAPDMLLHCHIPDLYRARQLSVLEASTPTSSAHPFAPHHVGGHPQGVQRAVCGCHRQEGGHEDWARGLEVSWCFCCSATC